MNHLTIPILEFVQAQPAHKLPVRFTLDKTPLPEASESPEEIFGEVLRLQNEKLVEAHVIRDISGKPYQAEIRYVTLAGRVLMNATEIKIKEKDPHRRVFLWGIVGIVILMAAIIASHGGHFTQAFWNHKQESQESAFPKP
jgi:hypothetical protein